MIYDWNLENIVYIFSPKMSAQYNYDKYNIINTDIDSDNLYYAISFEYQVYLAS